VKKEVIYSELRLA